MTLHKQLEVTQSAGSTCIHNILFLSPRLCISVTEGPHVNSSSRLGTGLPQLAFNTLTSTGWGYRLMFMPYAHVGLFGLPFTASQYCFGKVFPVWNFHTFYFMHANCPNRDGNQSSTEHLLDGYGRVVSIMMM